MRRKIVAGIVAVAALLAAAATPASAQNRWGANYFPNVTLTTQDGKTVHFYDDLIKGKIVAINLIYTTCQYACPLETARLAQVQKTLGDRMGRDVFFYSITIDPEHDTPAVLKDYSRSSTGPGSSSSWATGDIDLISKKIGVSGQQLDSLIEPADGNSDRPVDANRHTAKFSPGRSATGWPAGRISDQASSHTPTRRK
jgi:protein SCO1/2